MHSLSISGDTCARFHGVILKFHRHCYWLFSSLACMSTPSPIVLSATATYAQRVTFVTEIARRLHSYGTTAQRLEATVIALAQRLHLECAPWSNPTGIILSFSDPAQTMGPSDITRVIRLEPGINDLHKLAVADQVADAVANGQMSIAEGHVALQQLDIPPDTKDKLKLLFSYCMGAAAIAGLWRLPWPDIATAAVIGLMIGPLLFYSDRQLATREASEALAALVAGFVATLVASFITPLNLNMVIVSALMMLLPGMALTNAFNELTSQQWVSGVARLAGALTSIMKLTVGAVIAVTLAQFLGLQPQIHTQHMVSNGIEWLSAGVGVVAFTLLIGTAPRDYPWAISAALSSYSLSRYGSQIWGGSVGIFLAATVLTAAGNLFGRVMQRPGAIVRLPGIIMLVPGSSSLYAALSLMQLHQIQGGPSAVWTVMNVVIALVAGLLFGNLLLPARKNL